MRFHAIAEMGLQSSELDGKTVLAPVCAPTPLFAKLRPTQVAAVAQAVAAFATKHLGLTVVDNSDPLARALALSQSTLREGEQIQWNKPLFDSDGFEHSLVTLGAHEVVTKHGFSYSVWDRKSGRCGNQDCTDMTIGNAPLSDQVREQRKEDALLALRDSGDPAQVELARRVAPQHAALPEYFPMDIPVQAPTLREVVEKFGLERLRGLPVADGKRTLYISDKPLDDDIALYADEPHKAWRIKRFYGGETYNADMVVWISVESRIRFVNRLERHPIRLAPGDWFIVANPDDPGEVADLCRVERINGDTLDARSVNSGRPLSFDRSIGTSIYATDDSRGVMTSAIVLNGQDLNRWADGVGKDGAGAILAWARSVLYPHVPQRELAEQPAPRQRPAGN